MFLNTLFSYIPILEDSSNIEQLCNCPLCQDIMSTYIKYSAIQYLGHQISGSFFAYFFPSIYCSEIPKQVEFLLSQQKAARELMQNNNKVTVTCSLDHPLISTKLLLVLPRWKSRVATTIFCHSEREKSLSLCGCKIHKGLCINNLIRSDR